MIKKRQMLVITFRTTTDAMAMETACKEFHIPGRLIPVPKMISAGCGMAWSVQPELEEELRQFMEEKTIHPEGIHRCMI